MNKKTLIQYVLYLLIFIILFTFFNTYFSKKKIETKLETKEEIITRIKDALHFIDKEQLIVAPDCGLGHLSRDLAKTKLKIMVDAAKSF